MPLYAVTLCDCLGRLRAVPDGRQRADCSGRQHSASRRSTAVRQPSAGIDRAVPVSRSCPAGCWREQDDHFLGDPRSMVMISEGCVYRRCGCADPVTGRQFGRNCPQLAGGRHGSWYVRLELPAGLDGRRRRIRRGGYPSRKAAVAVLASLRGPRPGEAGGRMLTVGDWLAHWLVSRTAPAASTVHGYTAHVRLYLAPYLGQVLLAAAATRSGPGPPSPASGGAAAVVAGRRAGGAGSRSLRSSMSPHAGRAAATRLAAWSGGT